MSDKSVADFRLPFVYDLETVGGERASTTTHRLAGRACCWCNKPFDRAPWQGGERACEKCKASFTHRIYMHFVKRDPWIVSFFEADCKTAIGRGRRFTSAETIRLISRT